MIITSMRSLRDHVSALLGEHGTDTAAELIAEVIESDINCPEYGEDWREFIDKLDFVKIHKRLFECTAAKFYPKDGPVERWTIVDDLCPIMDELAERGYGTRGYWKWTGDRFTLNLYLDPNEPDAEGRLELFGLNQDVLVTLIENANMEA